MHTQCILLYQPHVPAPGMNKAQSQQADSHPVRSQWLTVVYSPPLNPLSPPVISGVTHDPSDVWEDEPDNPFTSARAHHTHRNRPLAPSPHRHRRSNAIVPPWQSPIVRWHRSRRSPGEWMRGSVSLCSISMWALNSLHTPLTLIDRKPSVGSG